MGRIIIDEMASTKTVSFFLKNLSRMSDDDEIVVEIANNQIYPVACVPICGIIQKQRALGKNIICNYSPDSFLSIVHFDKPFEVSRDKNYLSTPFSKIWRFETPEEAELLTNAFIDELSMSIECSQGIIDSLNWCLYEVLDNVFRHSLCNEGYIMGVIHKSSNYILITVYDNGQGIYNSLRDSEFHPRVPFDALTLSVQEGKTRDKQYGQGNGLWGLHNIILSNKGGLEIASHGDSLVLTSSGTTANGFNFPVLDRNNGTTAVSFNLNYSNNIEMSEILGGYIPTDLRFENKLDDNDNLVFSVVEEHNGLGTRVAGERLRNKLINDLIRLNKPTTIIIDFDGISVISSSFADEFIGKLVEELGFSRFNNIIKIVNVTTNVEHIINRSVSQRMAQMLYS